MYQFPYRLFLTVDESGVKRLYKIDVFSPIQLFPGLKVLNWGIGKFHIVNEVRLIQTADRDGRDTSEGTLIEVDLTMHGGTWQINESEWENLRRNGWTLCRSED